MAASNASTSGLLIIERILRDRDSIWRQIGDERDLGKLTTQMLASSAVALFFRITAHSYRSYKILDVGKSWTTAGPC